MCIRDSTYTVLIQITAEPGQRYYVRTKPFSRTTLHACVLLCRVVVVSTRRVCVRALHGPLLQPKINQTDVRRFHGVHTHTHTPVSYTHLDVYKRQA